jgi:thioredoxin-related protein
MQIAASNDATTLYFANDLKNILTKAQKTEVKSRTNIILSNETGTVIYEIPVYVIDSAKKINAKDKEVLYLASTDDMALINSTTKIARKSESHMQT